jgi:hypothetical protein
VVLPLLDTGLLGQSRELLIPAFKLGVRNQLEYTFSFGYLPSDSCSDTQLETTRAMIDGDSKIDFSGHPHYAELPHLGYFATSGFPFTRYADLSQTTVLLPETPVAGEIETMLALLARMGESTGYPATHLDVEAAGSTADKQRPIDRDLLLVGAAKRLPLLHRWRDRLSTRDMTQPALFGLESPLAAGRSVVVATAPEPQRLQEVLNLLEDDKLAYTLHGGAVLIQEGQPTSLPAKQDYTIGKLPFWTAIWYPLSGQPVLLALMSALAVLIFAFALWRTLKATAAKRLE